MHVQPRHERQYRDYVLHLRSSPLQLLSGKAIHSLEWWNGSPHPCVMEPASWANGRLHTQMWLLLARAQGTLEATTNKGREVAGGWHSKKKNTRWWMWLACPSDFQSQGSRYISDFSCWGGCGWPGAGADEWIPSITTTGRNQFLLTARPLEFSTYVGRRISLSQIVLIHLKVIDYWLLLIDSQNNLPNVPHDTDSTRPSEEIDAGHQTDNTPVWAS